MRFLKDRTLVILTVILFLVTILIALGLSNYHIEKPNIMPSNVTYNFGYNLSEQQKKAVNITLEDARIKKELAGQTYEIISVDPAGSLVQIHVIKDGQICENIAASVDLRNNSVSFINREAPPPYPIPSPPLTPS